MILQTCPACKKELELTAFPASHRGRQGKQCSPCHVQRQRIRNLRVNYNLTPDDVTAMAARQHGRCLGCQQELPNNFVIDHNHETNKVRGLLCRTCNLVLGLVKERKAQLTRLRLYLDRDPAQTNVYLIGSLRNERVPIVGRKLREHGYEVWDEWVAAGPEADDHWQRYETQKGLTYQEALRGMSAENVFLFDRALLDLADIGVLVMPAGKSGHLELGYMAGQGKPTFILQTEAPDRYDVMPQFATSVATSVEELIKELPAPQLTFKGIPLVFDEHSRRTFR